MMRSLMLIGLFLTLSIASAPALAQGSGKVVKVGSGESVYKIKRGASAQVAVVIDIDEGYHINSNRPTDKNLIPTSLKLDKVTGITTAPIVYPKAKLQKFEFSPKPLSVFEGKTVLKLAVRALPSAAVGSQTLKGKLTVQACNDQACLRPQTIDVSIPLLVE